MERALAIRRMHEDRRAAGTPGVIGMAMGDDESGDLRGRAAESDDRRMQTGQRSTHAGVDDGDFVLEDRVRRGPDERDRMDRGTDPRTR
jgi:hypothetical protein